MAKEKGSTIRAYESATINFGLVSTPVNLYSPLDHDQEIHFNQLHATCHSKLQKGKMHCPTCNVDVENGEIEKGYEMVEGQFVVLSKEEMVKVEATKAIEITEFVPLESVDPLFFDSAYYLGPKKGAERPFTLLTEALKRTGKAAIGKYASRGKDAVVLIRPYANGMILHKLAFKAQIRPYENIGFVPTPAAKKEIDLAVRLVGTLESKTFNPSQYVDTIYEQTMELLRAKFQGREVYDTPQAPASAKPTVNDLEALLEASLAKGE